MWSIFTPLTNGNGLPYLVMEYVSGSSLQQKIDGGGALQAAQILRIGMQIASGLAAAHAQGLVHRDIKPANILLENSVERVKITDFGLARSIDDVQITQAGAVYGTPLYMSPEQAQGERVDQRSDLFSLGSVMYAMCTGRPPFRGDTSLAVLKRVCDDTPRPIREVNPEIPAALAEIVNKLMAKNPDARFQTAGAVAELLSRYLAHLQHDPLTPYQVEGQPQPLAPRPARTRNAVGGCWSASRFCSWASLCSWCSKAPASPAGRAALYRPVTAASAETAADSRTKPAVPHRSKTHPPGAVDRPVKVFVLAGDSNMAGRAQVTLLRYQAFQPETKKRFQHLLEGKEWVVREDVWVKSFQQKGNLTVGFGQEPDRFGPELEFGRIVGDYFDEQVLLIKTCWGGHNIYRDFRPPSSGLPSRDILEKRRQESAKSETPYHLCRCGKALWPHVSGDVERDTGDVGPPRQAFSHLSGSRLRDCGVRVVFRMERHSSITTPPTWTFWHISFATSDVT